MIEVYITYGIILAILFIKWLKYHWIKELWLGSGKYNNYVLGRSILTKRLILTHYTGHKETCYKLIDRNKDGVPDFKKLVVDLGYEYYVFKEEVTPEDKIDFAHALQQSRRLN